ncbi:MAG: ATP-binding protein [bacterium]|nr:ATP-binding protein [Acidimicrobiia bacterium]MCY4650767.1 ATP-binding protein [bacterium]
MSEILRFAPSILARLGEELVSHPDQGIVELVKNAYDADARLCQVTLSETTQHGGRVIVRDDGDGMTIQQIRDGWLVLGRSGKDPMERTRLGRLPVGEKGLGRLAALRLGQRVVLVTRPRDEPGAEYCMEIDWALFDNVPVVEDVPLEIEKRPTSEGYGTSITISNLVSPLRRMDTKRLARSLIPLADPFESDRSFSAELISDDFRDLEQLVTSGYFDEAHHRLRAELDPDARGSAVAMDHRGNIKWKADHRDLGRSGTYRSPRRCSNSGSSPSTFRHSRAGRQPWEKYGTGFRRLEGCIYITGV